MAPGEAYLLVALSLLHYHIITLALCVPGRRHLRPAESGQLDFLAIQTYYITLHYN